MTTPITSRLQPSAWLAKRLGISVATVEKLRAAGSTDLPPFLTIGRSVRYDEAVVENWLRERLRSASTGLASDRADGGHHV